MSIVRDSEKILEKYDDRDAAIGDVIEQARYMMV